MDTFERLVYFVVGCGLGFILGYLSAMLRSIKTKVDHMEKEVHEVHTLDTQRARDEEGSVWTPSLTHAMLLVVVVVTVLAAFSAGQTNKELDKTVLCLTLYNTQQNEALAARDNAIRQATTDEIELWTLYESLYSQVRGKHLSLKEQLKLQDKLSKAIVNYRDNLIKVEKVRGRYEYNDPNILNTCERVKRNQDD